MASYNQRRISELKHMLKNAGSFDSQTVEDLEQELKWCEEWDKMTPKPPKAVSNPKGPKEKKD